MILIPFISALAFSGVILFLRRGLYRLDNDSTQTSTSTPENQNLTFSVVIAARNEEKNIGECLKTILAQENIPANSYEIIVIDDRSDDTTPNILQDIQNKIGGERLKVITIYETPPGLAPKKYAVSQGVEMASNEVIVFTDADCRVSSQWLSTIGKYFTPDTGLVQGITTYNYTGGMDKFFWGLQSVDFLSHGIVAAAAIGAGLPINSNANNFAFRKAAFEEAGGYGEGGRIVSGDDDYMLQKIWRTGRGARGRQHGHKPGQHRGQRQTISKRWDIRFMADPSGGVVTAPTETAAGVFEQRKRWGSKTVHYHPKQIILLSSVFIFYLMTAFTAIASIFDISYLAICASMLFVKLSGELVLMIPGTRMFNKKELRKYILPASLIQLPMVLVAIFWGVFGKFEWKGLKTGRVVKRG